MPVIKEWKCLDCGYFESAEPICPLCGTTEVKRVFLTPPSFKSDKTKLTDENIESLSRQFGMTDYSNNLSTKHEAQSSHIWGKLPTQNAGDGKKSIDMSGELSRVINGGINVPQAQATNQLGPVPVAPGQYETIFDPKHPEDKGRQAQFLKYNPNTVAQEQPA